MFVCEHVHVCVSGVCVRGTGSVRVNLVSTMPGGTHTHPVCGESVSPTHCQGPLED